MLSEVGMLPAELMGLNTRNFKQLNSLIKNQKFLRALIQNVQSTLHFVKNNRFNSIYVQITNFKILPSNKTRSTNLTMNYYLLIQETFSLKTSHFAPLGR